jgi:hypothetical protein
MEGPVKKILIVEDNSDSREILGLLNKDWMFGYKGQEQQRS